MDESGRGRFCGTWRLVAVAREDAATGAPLDADVSQTGTIAYTPEGRVSVIIARHRGGAAPEITAYGAAWTIEGPHVVHAVDIATRPEWVGTRQLRAFRFEGDRLTLTPPESEDYTHKRATRRSLTWERIGAPPTLAPAR